MPAVQSLKGSQFMPAFARRSLFITSILLFMTGSAVAWPAQWRRKPKTPPAPSSPSAIRPAERGPFPTAPYAGPPPMALVHAVRTPPLRTMKVIPPPRRGDELEKFEPPHPQRPTDVTKDDGRRQMSPSLRASAPAATGLSF